MISKASQASPSFDERCTSGRAKAEVALTTTKSLFSHRVWDLAPVIDPSHRLNAIHTLLNWSLVIRACAAWPKVFWRVRGSMSLSLMISKQPESFTMLVPGSDRFLYTEIVASFSNGVQSSSF